jgi:hypothetical protein
MPTPRKDTKWSFADQAERETFGSLGTGVSTGDLAFQEDTRELYTWDGTQWRWVATLGGSVGVPQWGNVAFKYAAGDPSSLPFATSPVTFLRDLTSKSPIAAANIDQVALVDSHLFFDGGTTGNSRILIPAANRSPDTVDIFSSPSGGSMTFWARIRGVGEGGFGRFIDTQGPGNGFGYYFATRGANPTGAQLEFVRRYSTTNGVWRIDLDALEQAVPFDSWVHIGLVFEDVVGDGNPGTVPAPIMTVNGVQATAVVEVTPPNGTPVTDAAQPLIFGNRLDAARAFDGDLDSATLWPVKLSLAELAQDYAATRPQYQGGTGLQLVDKVEVAVSTASVTLNGLDSARDGAYLVIGKLVTEPINGFGQYELRPVPGAALAGIDSELRINDGSPFTSATGWVVGIQLISEPTSSAAVWFQAWIWPQKAKFGASGNLAEARMFRANCVQWRNVTDELQQLECYGRWLDANDDSAFESMTLDGVGVTLAPGSEVAIYKLSQGVDPI